MRVETTAGNSIHAFPATGQYPLAALGEHGAFVAAGFIPQSQLYAVPEPQFVVDGAEIVFDDVFCGADLACDFLVFESLGDEFDDALLALVGTSGATDSSCEHSCLRYKSVASLTRLTPLSIPKRTNNLLKWAFTVLRAMFNCLEISSLSQP